MATAKTSVKESTKKKEESIFEQLSAINVKEIPGAIESFDEHRDGLTYINKVWVERFLRERFGSEFSWTPIYFDANGIELEKGKIGMPFQRVLNSAFVWVEVTIKGETHRQFLPVQGEMMHRDAATGEVSVRYNQSMPLKFINTTMLNRSIYRCFVKCVALGFGLGIDVYAGKVQPPAETETSEEPVDKDEAESNGSVETVAEDEPTPASSAIESVETNVVVNLMPKKLPTIDEAKAHKCVDSAIMKGKLVGVELGRLLRVKHEESIPTMKQVFQRLARTSEEDKAYATVLLRALGDGTVSFTVMPQPTESASEEDTDE